MKPRLSRLLTGSILILLCMFANNARATHIYGMDFYYTWLSGNTYTITLAVYGDCAGQAFSTLQTSVPQVQVMNNNTGLVISNLNLNLQGPGVEVTPVCPSQVGNTACINPLSAIPGVKRYIYSTNYTLTNATSNWRFRFTGLMGANSSAGRSNSINNIVSGTITAMEATLNVSAGAPNNSSPVYTTIPTPFFCVNKAANYNPGTVDPNGDSLDFSLVPGLLSAPPNGTVSYNPTYSATAPLHTVPSTFSFSTTNGQLSFTPDIGQQSLVVNRVAEYRNGVLVGTSMREMTFVVLTNCNNNPPGGNVFNPSNGSTQINNTTVRVCRSQGNLSFNIVGTDLDGDAINMTWAGLPTGATFTVSGNNTPNPSGQLTWNVSTAAPGTYTFFVTYTDNGCPLSSKQTLAYTIIVSPDPTLTFNLITPATCTAKAVFTLTPSQNSPWTITIRQGTTVVHSFPGLTGPQLDSLAPGTYTFTVVNSTGCPYDTTITVSPPPLPSAITAISSPICLGQATGSIQLSGVNGTAPYSYALGTGPYSSNGSFTGLGSGSYVLHIRDANSCVKDTTIILTDSTVIGSTSVISNVLCFGGNTGSVTVTGSGGLPAYTYAIGAGAFGSNNVFGSLVQGIYTVRIKDANGCMKDTNIVITQPTALTITAAASNISCAGGNDGTLSISGSGGTQPYEYALNAGAFGSSGSFASLTAGTYVLHARDANGCLHDTTITLTQPAPLAFTLAIGNVLCFGGSTGTVTVNASGGTPAYSYAADAGPFGPASALTGFAVGSHTIHLKDANGCTKDTTITITQPAVLGIGGSFVAPACFGTATGSVTISGNGGTSPYTYALDGGPYGTAATIGSVAAGSHIMRVKDANGCTKDSNITIGEPTAVTVTAGIKRPRCSPLVNGIVTLYPGGGTPGYTYAVGSSAYGSSAVFNNLGSGTYTFHVKDSKGCIKDTTITVTDSVFLNETLAITNANCWGVANGSVEVFPGGGDAPYNFALGSNPYSATNPIINVAAGTYVLHLRDANGCIKDSTITVTQPARIVPAAQLTQPLCFGDANGQITISAGGGVPNYTFAQGAGPYGLSGSFTGLSTGTYTFHVQDINGCIRDTTVTLGQPTILKIDSVKLTNLLCFGDNSGTATLYASGATPTYTYANDAAPFVTANLLTGLSAGAHVLHVKDANGCTKDTNISLTQPPALHFGPLAITTATCEGMADGRVVLSGLGGTPWTAGYQYSDDNAGYTDRRFFPGLREGAYTFYVKDSNNCVRDTTVQVPGYPHINLDGLMVTGPSCYGMEDGVIAMNSTGGNSPLTYQLLRPARTNNTGVFDSLAQGSYSLRVQDATGCFKDTTLVMQQPDPLDVKTTVTGNDCLGPDDGGIAKATGTGGTQPYTFTWRTPSITTGEELRGLPNGPVPVQVTDARGCTDTTTALIAYDNCCTPYIPNAFTPNGDGKNDVFRVVYKGDISALEVGVYNRYGQRVFVSYSADVSWDGTFHGIPQDLGTYYYRIKFICGNGGDRLMELKGDITLIR